MSKRGLTLTLTLTLIDSEVIPFCVEKRIGILPWSPIAQGLLTGKYHSVEHVPAGRQRSRLFSHKRPQQRHGEAGLEKETFEAIGKMKWIAERSGTTLTNASLAWLLEQDGVASVLMGARNAEQLHQNLACLSTKLDKPALALLADAGNEIRQKLGKNLDPYESLETTRIK